MRLGDKLKEIRLQNHVTLVGLSKAAGVSKSMLSRIERNQSAPTITTLEKIASALGVDLASLFTDLDAGDPAVSQDRSPHPAIAPDRSLDADNGVNGSASASVSVVRSDQRRKVIMPWGATYELLCPDMQHRIEFISMNYPVGGGSHDLYSHDGEECGIVLQGRFRGIVGDQEFVLEAGDSIYYASSIPHRWENAGDVEARAIWAITPPSF
jgi:DNA-binding XRE family transcriptional regulator/mannose-6-phosphate isomerase-like protein (cupin superfamily)